MKTLSLTLTAVAALTLWLTLRSSDSSAAGPGSSAAVPTAGVAAGPTALKDAPLPEFCKQYWPPTGGAAGEPYSTGVGEVRDGYIVWNGKPFFRNLHHGWSLWSHKRQDFFQVYRYYLLCNVASIGAESKNGAVALEQKGIDEGVKADIVFHRFREATRLYGQKVLVSHYLNGLQYEVPKSMAGLTEEALFDAHTKYIADAAAKFAAVWKHHPALGGYEISEEYWLPGYHAGSFFPPKSRYVAWLKAKYGTIEKLNAARGESYKSFDDVPAPNKKVSGERGASNLDYADFLMADNERRLHVIYDSLKAVDPTMLVAAAKGEFGRAEWYYAPPCDLFGWYCAVPKGYGISNVLPRTAAEHFNKALEFIHVDYCRYAKRDEQWKEGEAFVPNYRGLGYGHTITEIFEGMKQQWLEDYNDGSFHYFHPTKMIKEAKEIRTWSGQRLYFHKDGLEGPDVIAEPSTLGMSRAFAWCQRAAPLFLPTKVVKGNTAVLQTDRSPAVGGFGVASRQWREMGEALRRLHVSYGIVRDANLAELKDYKVLIAGGPACACPPAVVAAVKDFVKSGGKLVLMPEAFTLDEWHNPAPAVRKEMEAIAAARLDDLPAYKEKDAIEYKLSSEGGWPAILQKYQAALASAGMLNPTGLHVGGDMMAATDATIGLLKGDGYWLVGIANFGPRDLSLNVFFGLMPEVAGTAYEVIDITGQPPKVKKDELAGFALATDEASRAANVIDAKWTGRDTAGQGRVCANVGPLDVTAGGGKILLVRPAGQKVVVSCPQYEVRTIALRKVGVDIVLPDKPSDAVKKAADALAAAVKAKGGDAKVVTPADIRIEKTHFDAFIHPEPAKYESKVAVFDNAPLATKRNLIVIGSEETNSIAKHLGAVGTFTYDKVLERITDKYPGKGRGLVGVVESVNDPSFDPTDQTRDALLVGGSDEDGTLAAVAEAARIVSAK
ncbi:MAG: beta-galactosidase [Phycisphaerae bacterium]